MRTIYFDTETTGLNPHTDRVVLFQYRINDGPTQLIQNPDPAECRSLLDSADLIVAHNTPFDFGMLDYIPKSIDHFDDTLYLDRIAHFEADKHSLDVVAARVFGRDLYDGLDKKALQKTKWDVAELTPEQITYATLDVDGLPTIHEQLLRDFPRGLESVYRFDKKSIVAGLKAQRHGLPIRHDDLREEISRVEGEAHRLQALLAPLNVNSPKQVTAALGIESSGDRVLAGLVADGNKQASLIRECRGQLKYLNFLTKLGAKPRFYGTLQPAARSGRFTSSKENIQNLPRDTKRFIGSDTNVILSADFAQLELRTIAAITGDEAMCDLFRSGADLHNYAAEQLFGADYTKTDRQIAKVFNFSTLYGAGVTTIGLILLTQTGISLPEHEIKQYKNKWLAAFPGIAAWQKQGFTRHEMGYPHQTPHGRPYTSARSTDHLSIENQGAGAEVARIALHRISDTLPQGAELINFIHDSYVVEAPNDPAIYKPAAAAMKAAMEYAWERAPLDRRGITMPVEVGVAHDLKSADALENCIYTLGEQ